MADDDRYRWLDEEAAERLLRGQSVDARSALRAGRHAESHGNAGSVSGTSAGRPGAATPSWARREARGPQQHPRHSEDAPHPAERLAAVLEEFVAEQTATAPQTGERHSAQPAPSARSTESAESAELPGEAAALEAFRAVHARTGVHSGTVEISAGPTEAGTVIGRRAVRDSRGGRTRDRRPPGAARRVSLGGRPLRAGFAMAVAGCALGGAAVAASTGVLPTPFGDSKSPAASVSPLASPSEGERDAAQGGSGSAEEDNGPRRGTREGGGSSGPSDSPSGEDLAGTERGREGRSPKEPGPGRGVPPGGGLSGPDKQAIARALCTAYENGELAAGARLKLEQAAGGPADVEKFCDKYGGSSAQSGGGSGGPGGPGGPGNSGGSGSDGGGDGGGDGDSSSGGGSGSGGIGTPGGDPDGGDGEPDGFSAPDDGDSSQAPDDDSSQSPEDGDSEGAAADSSQAPSNV